MMTRPHPLKSALAGLRISKARMFSHAPRILWTNVLDRIIKIIMYDANQDGSLGF